MKKKQWYVFSVLFFLLFLVFEIASGRPQVYLVEITSLSDLAHWMENQIEKLVSIIFIVLCLGCTICTRWAED